jgi:hypothetical protein
MKDFLVVVGGLVLIVIGSCMMKGGDVAFCKADESNNWVCVGPCAGPGTCPGYGCVCVGASTGVGECVSE